LFRKGRDNNNGEVNKPGEGIEKTGGKKASFKGRKGVNKGGSSKRDYEWELKRRASSV